MTKKKTTGTPKPFARPGGSGNAASGFSGPMGRKNGTGSRHERSDGHGKKEPSNPWTREEAQQLYRAVQRLAPTYTQIDWAEVAKHLGGRTGKQCREKWKNDLRPGLSKEPWCPQEEYMLALAHSKFGNCWSEVAKFLPTRAENTIKNHWYATNRAKAENKMRTFLWVYGDLVGNKGMKYGQEALDKAKEIYDQMAQENDLVDPYETIAVPDDHYIKQAEAARASAFAALPAVLGGPTNGFGPTRSGNSSGRPGMPGAGAQGKGAGAPGPKLPLLGRTPSKPGTQMGKPTIGIGAPSPVALAVAAAAGRRPPVSTAVLPPTRPPGASPINPSDGDANCYVKVGATEQPLLGKRKSAASALSNKKRFKAEGSGMGVGLQGGDGTDGDGSPLGELLPRHKSAGGGLSAGSAGTLDMDLQQQLEQQLGLNIRPGGDGRSSQEHPLPRPRELALSSGGGAMEVELVWRGALEPFMGGAGAAGAPGGSSTGSGTASDAMALMQQFGSFGGRLGGGGSMGGGRPLVLSDGGANDAFFGGISHEDLDSGDALDLVGDLAQDDEVCGFAAEPLDITSLVAERTVGSAPPQPARSNDASNPSHLAPRNTSMQSMPPMMPTHSRAYDSYGMPPPQHSYGPPPMGPPGGHHGSPPPVKYHHYGAPPLGYPPQRYLAMPPPRGIAMGPPPPHMWGKRPMPSMSYGMPPGAYGMPPPGPHGWDGHPPPPGAYPSRARPPLGHYPLPPPHRDHHPHDGPHGPYGAPPPQVQQQLVSCKSEPMGPSGAITGHGAPSGGPPPPPMLPSQQGPPSQEGASSGGAHSHAGSQQQTTSQGAPAPMYPPSHADPHHFNRVYSEPMPNDYYMDVGELPPAAR